MQPVAKVQAARATSVRYFTAPSCVLAGQRIEGRRLAQGHPRCAGRGTLTTTARCLCHTQGAAMVDTVIVEAEAPAVSAVSWPAIIAGGFVAAAFTLLLLALGAGIGFS